MAAATFSTPTPVPCIAASFMWRRTGLFWWCAASSEFRCWAGRRLGGGKAEFSALRSSWIRLSRHAEIQAQKFIGRLVQISLPIVRCRMIRAVAHILPPSELALPLPTYFCERIGLHVDDRAVHLGNRGCKRITAAADGRRQVLEYWFEPQTGRCLVIRRHAQRKSQTADVH